MTLSLTAFNDQTNWIRSIDAEPDVYAERGAVFLDFYGTLEEILRKGDDGATTCLDIWADAQERWVAYDDARDIDPDQTNHWRWIVTAD